MRWQLSESCPDLSHDGFGRGSDVTLTSNASLSPVLPQSYPMKSIIKGTSPNAIAVSKKPTWEGSVRLKKLDADSNYLIATGSET